MQVTLRDSQLLLYIHILVTYMLHNITCTAVDTYTCTTQKKYYMVLTKAFNACAYTTL